MKNEIKKQDHEVKAFDCPPELSQKENVQLQYFTAKLNREPDPKELSKVPMGDAMTLPISFIEMTLDEMFYGQWSTENFKWNVMTNEVLGSIELVVVHPINGKEIRRTGTASVQIMVDKVPDEIKSDSKLKNKWALDPSNKKSNAMDMGFGKLKAECVKNAAISLGKMFGRDVNRDKKDVFKGQLKPMPLDAFEDAKKRIVSGELGIIEIVTSHFIVTDEQVSELASIKPNKQLAQ